MTTPIRGGDLDITPVGTFPAGPAPALPAPEWTWHRPDRVVTGF
ncbi:hypothetical protein [Catenuloplanes indicus]|uniref:Uncharacterized protein n=1 Tax=Catenuloplanes indicus TaxID=137267 RepID=A0AAE3VUR2_9ACTN|nr:hypothetical protein [Catenuloplanes indicus]MDQ0363704.1 hypothetical protein [Catenuloplanes indicus]